MLSEDTHGRNARSLSKTHDLVVRGVVADPRARPTVRPQRLALGVLARAPVAGAKLTRLSPPLTHETATELSTALLKDTLNSVAILPMGHRAVLTISEEEGEVLRAIVPARWIIVSAESESLGERLSGGFKHLFSTGAEGAAILSSDAPLLPLDEIFEGMLALTKKRRVLLGPTQQGGLYAVGTTQHEPALFEGLDPASKGSFARLFDRAKALGLETQTLKEAYAIEEPADLDRFARDLGVSASPSFSAPTCAALLARPGFRT